VRGIVERDPVRCHRAVSEARDARSVARPWESAIGAKPLCVGDLSYIDTVELVADVRAEAGKRNRT